MIILTIGDTSRRLSSPSGIDESWIKLHLRSEPAGETPGVHVRIDARSLSLNLSAGETCDVGAGVPRSGGEAAVLDLWRERGLDRSDYRSGQLVAFLHQLYDLLESVRRAEPAAAVEWHRTVVDDAICMG